MITVVFDAPLTLAGGTTTPVFVFDEHGCEIGWLSIDRGVADLEPTAAHPDHDYFGWPEGSNMDVGLYNNVDEEWACPSVEDAEMAVLYENAVRLDEGWYAQNSSCEV